MATLEELARNKFTDMSAAEERVVRNAPRGTVADCADLGGGDDPENADGTPEAPNEKWPDTRNVRADLIRWLCVDREAREQVDPRGVRIWGARIAGRLDLSFADILFTLLLLRCRVEQDIDLKYAKLPVLNLAGSWTGAIGADGLKLEGDILLRNGFHAEGEVRLLGATIGGDLNAEGGTLKNPNGNALAADGMKVTGSVFLKNGFSAEGEVRLVGATIGGVLSATGGTFRNSNGDALSADRVEVTGSVFLKDKFVAEGKVRLSGGEITGILEVDDAWLDALDLEGAQIAGGFFWRNIRKDPHRDFPDKVWERHLNLTNAKVGPLVDQEDSWPDKERLRLDGFVYDRIASGPTDATRRLKWLGLQPEEVGYLPQPYEQLIAVLRRMGHEHQVAKVAIAKQKDLCEHGDLGWWGKFWNRFLYRVIGYGYKPWWAFGWMAMLVLLGTLVFYSGQSACVGVMVPSDKEAYASDLRVKTTLPSYYPEFHALVYSLDVIFPFDLGQKSHWRLSENRAGALVYWLFEVYSLFQLFAGWVLLLVAGAVPAGFIKKD